MNRWYKILSADVQGKAPNRTPYRSRHAAEQQIRFWVEHYPAAAATGRVWIAGPYDRREDARAATLDNASLLYPVTINHQQAAA
jgi:hypothetical protein